MSPADDFGDRRHLGRGDVHCGRKKRVVNFGKHMLDSVGGVKRYRQPHVQFHFLLDYVPEFKRAYGRGGLIQYQPFIPKETAGDAFRDILTLCQRRGLPNYLTVLKRHKPDEFSPAIYHD
jgi:hypothetical protein